MNSQLKVFFEKIYNTCDTIDELHLSRTTELGCKSVRKLLEVEITSFVLYLATSDGYVDSREADYISEFFNKYLPPEEIEQIIKENDVERFKCHVPFCLDIFIETDSYLASKGIINETSYATLLIRLFELIGKDFVLSDGRIAQKEHESLDAYISLLKRYLNERKAATSQKSSSPPNTLRANYQHQKEQTNNMSLAYQCDYRTDPERYLETILYIETEKNSGTGFIFHVDGYALTCAHVVKDASEIYVRIGNKKGTVARARIVTIHEKFDLAVILIENQKCNLLYAVIGTDEALRLGNEIAILGYPFGSRVSDDVMNMSVSYTQGYISSIQTRNGVKNVLLDISAKAGNSGSPVISRSSGAVIGVFSGSIIGGVNNREEVNYMIPISYLLEMLPK